MRIGRLRSLAWAVPLAGAALFPAQALAADDAPAGGAAMDEVILATALGLIATAFVVVPVFLYRGGRLPALGRLADRIGRTTGLPGWAALPLALQGASLITAVFGMYWDISLHIDEGRDPGPLANPAHWFILVGLLGVMAAGVFGMSLLREPIRSSVHVRGPGWDAPAGAIMMVACGAFSLIAFPLDDVWHRIFGQDVTLWSPTHLMLITGASLSTLGGLALYREALEEGKDSVSVSRAGWLMAPLTGAFLIGLNTFMAEFDFAVPQFRLDFHPIGLMMAAGLALVSARLVIGPFGALAAVGFFILIRGALTVLVGPVLGQIEPHFPLYLAEAAVVELIALAFVRSGRPIDSMPVVFGAVAGVGIGTIGLAAEWGWSHVWVEHPWVSAMLPEAAILALLMAVSAGTIGGFIGRALTLRGSRLPDAGYWALIAPAAVAIGVVLYTLPISDGERTTSASFQLRNAQPPPEREVEGTIRLDPPDAAEDARWFNVTSWQGGETSIVSDLEEVSPGVYRTTEPIPVDGSWKSILRLHADDVVIGLPIFLPRDTGIPAPETPAPAQFRRDFVLDKTNLQREQKEGVSSALTTISYLAVLAMTVALILIIFWGLRRVQLALGRQQGPPPRNRRRLVPSPAGSGSA
jgi:hypothetical protein